MDDRLDSLAAELPTCLQPHYLAEVVRSFCTARGLNEANELYDYWHEAVMVAIEKRYLALRRGADHVAYIKRGVRFYLIGLNRKLDVRRATIDTLATKADEDADEETCAPTIEDFDRTAFDARNAAELKRLDDVRVALYATIADSPALAAYWRAYRETDGSDSKIAARLGLYRETVRDRFRKPFLMRFKTNYLAVRTIRGKAA